MRSQRKLVGLAVLFSAACSADAAILRAEVEGDTVVIYSSFERGGGCKASVMFSYRNGDKRQTRRLECNAKVPARKDYRLCAQSNPEFIDLKLEQPVIGGCEYERPAE